MVCISRALAQLTLPGTANFSKLQFQSATSNNAKKQANQANPNQQFFRIVISLYANVAGSNHHISSKISQPLIVRGQNPGRYGSKGKPTESGWISKRGNVVHHSGKVVNHSRSLLPYQLLLGGHQHVQSSRGANRARKYHGHRKHCQAI